MHRHIVVGKGGVRVMFLPCALGISAAIVAGNWLELIDPQRPTHASLAPFESRRFSNTTRTGFPSPTNPTLLPWTPLRTLRLPFAVAAKLNSSYQCLTKQSDIAIAGRPESFFQENVETAFENF